MMLGDFSGWTCHFRVLDWTKSGLKRDLRSHHQVCHYIVMCWPTRFWLGTERIIAKNDGAPSIRYDGSKIRGGDRMPLLSSLEVLSNSSISSIWLVGKTKKSCNASRPWISPKTCSTNILWNALPSLPQNILWKWRHKISKGDSIDQRKLVLM